MGKASRRKRQTDRQSAPARAPFVARPFEGLPAETEWVALREIVPAATAEVQVELPGADGPREVRLVSVLPGAMPAVHRADGTVLVALQSRTSSGDASRDIVQALLAATEVEPGNPVTSVRPATADTPRLQDVLVGEEPISLQVHEDFNFWVDDADPEAEALRATLEETNQALVPTERVDTVPSAFWCLMNGRAYVRWILPEDQDEATIALARLQAAGEHTLGGDTTLLGAFRAAGLLVPVLEVDPAVPSAEHGPALAELADRYAAAMALTGSLTPEERRARDGLVSRQVTLR